MLTQQQAFRLVTRLAVAYLLFWAMSDLLELPRQCFDLAHWWHRSTLDLESAQVARYYVRLYLLYISANVLKITLWLSFSLLFYRGSPRLQQFLMPGDSPQSS